MFLSDNNITYRKHFSLNNINKNWSSLKKRHQKETLQTLNILIKKQINFILETYGKKTNKIFVWSKKKQKITTFNKILKQKLKIKKLLYVLKRKKFIYVKRNKSKNILFLQFLEKVFNFNKKVINLLWKFRKKIWIHKSFNLISKIVEEKNNFVTKKINKKITFQLEKIKDTAKEYFYKWAKSTLLKRKFMFRRIKNLFIQFIEIEKINEIKEILLFFIRLKKKTKGLGDWEQTSVRTDFFLKIKKKKDVNVIFNKKKYKFFQNKLKNDILIFVRKNKRMNFKLKRKKHVIKLLKWKKLNDNKNVIQKKKIMLNFLLRWNNFVNETFFNNKKLIKKRKISIGSYSMRCINKNIVVFIDIFKNKRKFRRIKRMPTDYWYTALLRRFRKQKSLSKVYKKVNNTLLNIKIKQNWIKMNQTPVFFKTIHAFAYNSKGWRKILRIIRNSYNLQRFNKNIYFENTLFNTLISCHFKNPGSLTKNLGENLRKQWKHRQQLFFLYYLLMSILWHFKLKKVTSFQKIKTIYMMIRGKINSGTRTKYFQIKAPYKASFVTRQNHMTFAKGVARAKTGIFGIKSWIHY